MIRKTILAWLLLCAAAFVVLFNVPPAVADGSGVDTRVYVLGALLFSRTLFNLLSIDTGFALTDEHRARRADDK